MQWLLHIIHCLFTVVIGGCSGDGDGCVGGSDDGGGSDIVVIVI